MIDPTMQMFTRFRHYLKVVSFVSLVWVVWGCTPTIYGVPQPEWDRLNDAQKQETIKGYNERKLLREQAYAAEAERRAREAEVRAAEERRREEIRQIQIDAIYRGESGQIGDLIRVTIQGGIMRLAGKHRIFQPVSIKLASGEIRRIEMVEPSSRHNLSGVLVIAYREGILFLDLEEGSPNRATRLVYDSSWRRGASYTITTQGEAQLRDVRVGIEVIPHLRPK